MFAWRDNLDLSAVDRLLDPQLGEVDGRARTEDQYDQRLRRKLHNQGNTVLVGEPSLGSPVL